MPVDDHLAIEREMARRLRRRSQSQLLVTGLCIAVAGLAAGFYVYQEAKRPAVVQPPLPQAQAARPAPPPPTPVIDKDQTKLTTPAASEAEPVNTARAMPNTSSTRQIEIGQRPVAPPPPPAGSNEEPITMDKAPIPIPRMP